jgi:hypothetical protein
VHSKKNRGPSIASSYSIKLTVDFGVWVTSASVWFNAVTLSNAAIVSDDVAMVALGGNTVYRNIILHIKARTSIILSNAKVT